MPAHPPKPRPLPQRREVLRRALASFACLVAGALLFAGCGGDSGGPAPAGQGNFVVQNDLSKTVHVFVSGNEIGDVKPGASQDFFVDSGFRFVEFRERGDAFLTSHGAYTFSTTTTLRLRYDPGFSHNLRVINQSGDTVEVFAGLTSYGFVSPGQSADFRVDTGRRDLAFRRAGSSIASFFGTYNFNHTDVVEATVIP